MKEKTDMNALIEKIKQIDSSDALLDENLIFEYYDIPEDEVTERKRCKQAMREKAKELDCVKILNETFKEFDAISRSYDLQTKKYKYPEYISVKYNSSGASYLAVNPALLAEYIRKNCKYIIVRDGISDGTKLFWYDDGVYKQITDDELQGYIKGFISDVDKSIVKIKDVKEVSAQLRTDLESTPADDLNANEDIINFQNGLLRLSDGTLQPHSPDVLSTIQIPCYYDQEDKNAPTFTKFLDEFTNGKADVKRFLLQWMGVAISNIPGFRFKSALFMYGPGNTGKTQLLRLVQMLLGSRNCSTVDLSDLEKRFGTSYLYMKRLSGCGDISFVSLPELKVFKNLTGGERVFAETKGQNGFYFVYNGVLWYCMNELPRFGGDRGDWVYNRIIVVKCENVIPEERQDKELLQKLYAERGAIINMILPELQRVINNGYNFDIPSSCKVAKEEYIEINSPVRQFYKECCVMRPDGKINDKCTTSILYQVFKAWYLDNAGQIAPSNQKFRKELAEIHGVYGANELEIKKEFNRFYPFTLTRDAKIEYQRIYGTDRIGDVSQ